MKTVLKLSGIYVGVIIGAGFASGREIITFFVDYGKNWFIGMLLTGILFSYLGYILIQLIFEKRITSYQDFMFLCLGAMGGKIMDFVSGLFLCAMFFTMTAATASLANEVFGIHKLLGGAAMVLASYIVLTKGISAVVFVNAILSPFLIASGIAIGLFISIAQAIPASTSSSASGSLLSLCISALLYVSYNMITAVSLLLSSNSLILSEQKSKWAGFLGGLFMCAMGLCIGLVLYFNYESIWHLEIPLFAIVERYHPLLSVFYLLMLLAAIYTTSIGSGYSAIVWLAEHMQIKRQFLTPVLCLTALFLSLIDFSRFVDVLYPLFGALGLLEILCIVHLSHKTTKKSRK